MSKHAAKLNYRNIILTAVMVVLVIAVIILLVSLSSTQKQPEPFQSSSEESSSSAEKSSSESRPTLSSSAASSHSKISMIPDEPYKVDTTGKIVRNAFDENGEIDLLFPINTTYYVTRNFSVKHTEEIGDGKIMDARAAPHCREMLAAMRKEINSEITPFSALRTFKYQEGNFSRKMNKYLNKGYSEEDAFNTAATIVAIPGTSEHQLGLAVDIYLWDLWNRDKELNESFEDTKEFKWLSEHASEYGFILSFPKDKCENTGIIYEPWHYRYVGIENAEKIKKSGLTLEEWIDSQSIVYFYNAD